MTNEVYIIMNNKLPKKIAIFPLSNAIFFPKTILPLNIFEKRYIQLVSDRMKDHRLFGMVQPKTNTNSKPDVFKIGCLGKVVSFNETSDKRFIINLSGITRFKIKEELNTDKLYREFEVDYSDFVNDLDEKNFEKNEYDIKSLIKKIKIFFSKKNYFIKFDELERLDVNQFINTICMISPFTIEEKQKLLEAVKIEIKIKILEKLIDFDLADNFESRTIQ